MGSPEEVIPILEFISSKISMLDLVLVISQPAKKAGRGKVLTDPPVASYAKSQGIDTVQPESAASSEFIKSLTALRPDLIITAAYGQILSSEFLAVPRLATINVHPSLLPKYRGATPVQTALLNGDTTTGITILYTVKKMDAGNIISQSTVEIDPTETTADLMPRLFKMSGPLIEEAVGLIASGEYEGEIQSEADVSHCRKIKKNDGFINFEALNDWEVFNRYRGLFPWPGVYGYLEGARVSFEHLIVLSDGHTPAGEFSYDKTIKAIRVGTTGKDIAIKELKPAGKKKMDAVSFWNGLKNKSQLRFDRDDQDA